MIQRLARAAEITTNGGTLEHRADGELCRRYRWPPTASAEGRPSNMNGYGSLHDRLLELLKASPKLDQHVGRCIENICLAAPAELGIDRAGHVSRV
jgi:hypothetical protein